MARANEEEETKNYVGIVGKGVDNYRPVSNSEWASGMMIICVTIIAMFGMYLYNKRTSPSAKAEESHKRDLLSELNEFQTTLNAKNEKEKRYIDNKLAILDKACDINKLNIDSTKEQMHNLESNINQQIGNLHVRFGTLETTLNSILEAVTTKR